MPAYEPGYFSTMALGRLVFRLVVGALLVGHGTQKLFGWFGGQGPAGTAETFESVGLYWAPGSRGYRDTEAEIWFASEEFARANGFVRAD